MLAVRSGYEAYGAGLVGLCPTLGLEEGVERVRVVQVAQNFGYLECYGEVAGGQDIQRAQRWEAASRIMRGTWRWRGLRRGQ